MPIRSSEPVRRTDRLADTIVAVATPPGEGGIGIVRLSGEDALPIAGRLFRARSGKEIQSQKSFTVRFGHVLESGPSASAPSIDEALLLVMRGPKSYTGEDVAEISVHGGAAVLDAVVHRALEEGARMAQPGEFTKRAFLNGRMDLMQAEAVLDLIQAKTRLMRQWAASQLDGDLSKKMQHLKTELVDVLSHLEASVDFPDDMPDTASSAALAKRLDLLAEKTSRMLGDAETAFLAKRGFRVVLCGKPNVGKSSLMNRLTRSDRVIVTPYPGTTRDVVEAEGVLGGLPVRFVDTAGIHLSDHPIEREGIERSKKAMTGADLVLLVLDGSRELSNADTALMEDLTEKNGLIAINKTDLPQKILLSGVQKILKWPQVLCSTVSDRGTDALEEAIGRHFLGGKAHLPKGATVTTGRQRSLLEKVNQDLTRAARQCHDGRSPELAASDVREALERLGEMVGEVINDDILEALFKQFCIGK